MRCVIYNTLNEHSSSSPLVFHLLKKSLIKKSPKSSESNIVFTL